MSGHGSAPPPDQANHPGRKVVRPVAESMRGTAAGNVGGIMIPPNTRNPYSGVASVYELGTGGPYGVRGGRSGETRDVIVRSRRRANVAARSLARRGAEGRNINTGRQ